MDSIAHLCHAVDRQADAFWTAVVAANTFHDSWARSMHASPCVARLHCGNVATFWHVTSKTASRTLLPSFICMWHACMVLPFDAPWRHKFGHFAQFSHRFQWWRLGGGAGAQKQRCRGHSRPCACTARATIRCATFLAGGLRGAPPSALLPLAPGPPGADPRHTGTTLLEQDLF